MIPASTRTYRGERLPNLIIAGAQKAGTTWLHHVLKTSAHLQNPDTKELNFFYREDFADCLDEYAAHFPQESDAAYFYESSPNYLQPVTTERDVPGNIARTLDAPAVILLFRDPIDRYESCYIHHIAAGRIPYEPEITELSDDYLLTTRGRYATLLEQWLEQLPQTRSHLYDDLDDKPALVHRVMGELGLDNDIEEAALEIQVNTAGQKLKQNNWPEMPRLASGLRERLRDIYAPEVERLQRMIGRDLSHWLAR
ncbi:sulfotransferase domain-containing protein [Microbacterium karelineae]|uniref:sulfotransferase domain-containing protein n=1 Tax=Microbacterium karelineae TaxID=2654283 RepID=UPI0018D39B18|nr:sulfotransferase domain-containing protein [Microbacterium karelineae]